MYTLTTTTVSAEPLTESYGSTILIKVFIKPVKTLEQEFPSKDRLEPVKAEKQTNIVYVIGCKDCSWCYIGETGRCFATRKKEHVRNVGHDTVSLNIVNHSWTIMKLTLLTGKPLIRASISDKITTGADKIQTHYRNNIAHITKN